LMKIDSSEIEFVQGTSYQLTPSFTLDLYKVNSVCTVSQMIRAGKHAVTQNSDPKMTSLLYPALQALDIEYLNADVFFGDTKQTDICNLTNKVLAELGYRKRAFFLNELHENLNHMKHITFIDTYEELEKKIKVVNINVLVEFIDVIIFDMCNIIGIKFSINGYEFNNLTDIKNKYERKEIKSADIRNAVVQFIDYVNKPIRDEFSHDTSNKLLEESKYR